MKKLLKKSIASIIFVLFISIFSSCSGMYDTLIEYAQEETIYPAKFDTIAGKIGFERVEIDLCKKGRIPVSQMRLAKAQKTIVECDHFEKPLVIDSVCSWVNITGLTEPEEYTFKIYSEDEFGNRSIPREISLTPYTSYDLEQMKLLSPKMTESNSTVLLEWNNRLSGILFDCYNYSFEYTDKFGKIRIGGGEGDLPCCFIEDIEKGSTVVVKLTLQIQPKKNKDLIIDTVDWTTIIPITISESAGEAIFLKTPTQGYTIDLNESDGSDGYLFSWTKVENIDSYILKISTNSSFPKNETLEYTVGDVSSVNLNISEIEKIVSEGSSRCYWTVIPSSSESIVRTTMRTLNIYRSFAPSGMWLFDDPSDLFKASVGRPLVEVSLGPKIISADGPSVEDKAIFIPEYSYLTCFHELPPNPGDHYVNEYSVLMNIKLSNFNKWFSIADINPYNNNGEWLISKAVGTSIKAGELFIKDNFNPSYGNMSLNTWHKIIYSVKLDEYIKIFLDAKLVKIIGTNVSWKDKDFALRPELYLFKDDNSWNDRNVVYVSEVIVWGTALNDMEAERLDNMKFK